MKPIKKTITVVFILCLALAACAPTAPSSSDIQTAVANTVVALQTELAVQATSTALAMAPTVGAEATFTALPTQINPTPTNTIAPTATVAANYWISTWSDINVPENTVFKAREAFTKTWSLTNGGTETWTKDFNIIFVSGESMGITSVPLGVEVRPGHSTQISLPLTAPPAVGTYTANFLLETPGGFKFGSGPGRGWPFSVKIVVKDFFAVKSATLTEGTKTATCPDWTIQVPVTIKTNGAGDVNFYLQTSAGKSKTYTVSFADAGTKTRDVTLKASGSAALDVSVYIAYPNRQAFSSITITSPCP